MTHPNLIERLKPCPFCGATFASIDPVHVCEFEIDYDDGVEREHRYRWSVQCDNCTATTGNCSSEEDAISIWNTRTNDQAISALAAEVEEWKRIAGDFAGAAERCTEPPHYIVQPFLGLFKKYGAQLATLTKGEGDKA